MNSLCPIPCERAPPRARALLPATRPRASGPLGALLSSPALDARLPTALQVLQGRENPPKTRGGHPATVVRGVRPFHIRFENIHKRV